MQHVLAIHCNPCEAWLMLPANANVNQIFVTQQSVRAPFPCDAVKFYSPKAFAGSINWA